MLQPDGRLFLIHINKIFPSCRFLLRELKYMLQTAHCRRSALIIGKKKTDLQKAEGDPKRKRPHCHHFRKCNLACVYQNQSHDQCAGIGQSIANLVQPAVHSADTCALSAVGFIFLQRSAHFSQKHLLQIVKSADPASLDLIGKLCRHRARRLTLPVLIAIHTFPVQKTDPHVSNPGS